MNEWGAAFLGVVVLVCLWLLCFIIVSFVVTHLFPLDTMTIEERIVTTENIISSHICLENGARVNCSITNVPVQESTPSPG